MKPLQTAEVFFYSELVSEFVEKSKNKKRDAKICLAKLN